MAGTVGWLTQTQPLTPISLTCPNCNGGRSGNVSFLSSIMVSGTHDILQASEIQAETLEGAAPTVSSPEEKAQPPEEKPRQSFSFPSTQS